MPPDAWVLMNETWTQNEPGDYTIRVFVVSDLHNPFDPKSPDKPEILSAVLEKEINVHV
jgi:hypothetical protein